MDYNIAIWSGLMSPRHYIKTVPKEQIFKAVMSQDDISMIAEICDLFGPETEEGKILRDKVFESKNINNLEIFARLCPDEQLMASLHVVYRIHPDDRIKAFQWINKFPDLHSLTILEKVVPPNSMWVMQEMVKFIQNPKAFVYMVELLHQRSYFRDTHIFLTGEILQEFMKATPEIGKIENCIEVARRHREMIEILEEAVIRRFTELEVKHFCSQVPGSGSQLSKYLEAKYVIET